MTAKRRRRSASPLTSCAVPVRGSSAITRAFVARAIPIGWKRPVPTKRISRAPVDFAAAKLQPSTCPRSGVRPRPLRPGHRCLCMQEMLHVRDEVGVLDRGDKPDGLLLRTGRAFSRTATSKSTIHGTKMTFSRVSTGAWPKWTSTSASPKGPFERKVAGPVTGIAADDHLKPGVFQAATISADLPFQPLGELEGDRLCSPRFRVFR